MGHWSATASLSLPATDSTDNPRTPWPPPLPSPSCTHHFPPGGKQHGPARLRPTAPQSVRTRAPGLSTTVLVSRQPNPTANPLSPQSPLLPLCVKWHTRSVVSQKPAGGTWRRTPYRTMQPIAAEEDTVVARPVAGHEKRHPDCRAPLCCRTTVRGPTCPPGPSLPRCCRLSGANAGQASCPSSTAHRARQPACRKACSTLPSRHCARHFWLSSAR